MIEKIEKKINGFFYAAMGSMLGMIGLGLVFAIAPAFSLNVLRWGLTIILLVSGIAMVARDMSSGHFFSIFSTSLMGIFLILMGIIIALYPETINIVTIAFGIYMILNSFMQLSVASGIKGTNSYTIALVIALIELICGIIMIVRPGDSNEAVITIAGIVLIVYGISGLVDTIIIKSKVKNVSEKVKNAKKYSEKLLKDTPEAEVVEDDKKTKDREK